MQKVEWIDVKTKLPPIEEHVIVFVNGFVAVSEYQGKGVWAVLTAIGVIEPFNYCLKPSHWQPFPPKP